MDNITDTNTNTDGQVTAHFSTDNNGPTIILLETETMVIELSCVNEAAMNWNDNIVTHGENS
jgi:hypothetical protein